MFIPHDYDEQQRWLNNPFKVEHQKAIQKALKRTLYAPPKGGWKRALEGLQDPQI